MFKIISRKFLFSLKKNFFIFDSLIIPIKIKNLIAGSKNIGTTHVTNGCYRLHPVEWNIGEVAGHLAAKCLIEKSSPQEIRNNQNKLTTFQDTLIKNGVEIRWPDEVYKS